MKYILVILAIHYCFNSGLTQHNSSFDRVQNFSVELQASTTNNHFISQEIQLSSETTASFLTIAVFVNAPFSGHLHYQLEGQSWKPLSQYHEANHPTREIFELLFLPNQTTSIRFKSDQALPTSLSVRWLTLTATDQIQNTTSTEREDCNCPQPDFCGRSCWCPVGNCPMDATPVATAPSHIIVHHSASASTSNDFPAVVRSYWDFHVTINGWDDIGYNWLIDGEGVVYEGRGSGTQGAHFSCMNAETTGICMIGNFETSTPTPAAIAALEDMIAWEACDKIIVPADSSKHITSGALLANISGHRDGNDLPNSCTNTVCPGANLYPLLPGIRQNVTDYTCLNELVTTRDILQTPFSIFPNPGSGYFQMTGDLNQIAALQLFSQTGQITNHNVNLMAGQAVSNGILEIQHTGLFILKIIRKNGSVATHKLLVRNEN